MALKASDQHVSTAPVIAATAALVGAMVSILYGATLASRMFPVVGAQGTTALRLVFGALILGAILRPWRARPSRGVLPALIGYGVVLGTMNLVFYMAIRTIPLGIAVSLEFCGPLLVSTLSSRRASDFGWIGLAIAGLLLLSPPWHGGHSLDPAGVAYALAAAGCWALYIVFGQRAGGELGSQTTAIGTLIGACLILPIGIVHAGGALLRPAVLFSAIGVGVFSSALPFSLEMVALTRLPARVYGTLTSMEPAVGAVMGLVFLGQVLSVRQWAGIGVVVAAALGAAMSIRTPPVSPE